MPVQNDKLHFQLRKWHLALAVGLPFLVWLVTAGAMSWHPKVGNIDIAAGAGKFRDNCGACHIIEKGITTHHGPNLYDIGKLAATRKPPLTAAAYILESILDPAAFVAPTNRGGMPKNVARDLSPDEIRNIVAYLASRDATPHLEEIWKLQIPDLREKTSASPTLVSREQMSLAERVLRKKGGCLECHSLFRNAEHQIFAPALFSVGLKDKELVKQSILDPSKVISPAYHAVNLVLQNGKTISGQLLARTAEFVLVVSRDDNGGLVQQRIRLDDIDVEDGQPVIVDSAVSLMPSGFGELLTEDELEALINMIDQLN